MILDKIENIDRYHFDASFIKDALKNTFTLGKSELDKANDTFRIGLQYVTKDASECLWEGHRKYLDIHIILKGEEIVHVSDISTMTSTKSYDETDDYELFDGRPCHQFLLQPGMFLVLFPNEIHKTGTKSNLETDVNKFVFKKGL